MSGFGLDEDRAMLGGNSYPRKNADEDAVADFLRRKKITQCPTVCLLPTSVNLSEANRAVVRRYEDSAAQKSRISSTNRTGTEKAADARRKKSREFLVALQPTIVDIMRTQTGNSAIACELNARKILTAYGTIWTEASVRYALIRLKLQREK